MKKFKFVFTVLLCLAMVFPFIACGDNDSGRTTSKSTDISADLDPNAPKLPEFNAGNGKFTFLTTALSEDGGSLSGDIAPETLSADPDPVGEAAYMRKLQIENMYNVQLVSVAGKGIEVTNNLLKNAILAGDNSYDAAVMCGANFTSLLTDGKILADFEEVPYINMEKPYWNSNFYESMALLGKHYAADGDISIRGRQCVYIMPFNKNIIALNGMESPYDLVRDGQWTFDKMCEMAKSAANDMDGDGKMLLANDLYGLTYGGDATIGIINATGVKLIEINSDGFPQLTVGTEINVAKMMKIYEEIRNNSYSIDTLFNTQAPLGTFGEIDAFADERSLFVATYTSFIYRLREIDVNFGIIPFPKWSIEDEYIPTTIGIYHPVLVIPSTNENLEFTGAILEMLAYEGSKELIPEYYESLLKTKVARDNESEEMIDYIFENLQYDIGNILNLGDMLGSFGYPMSMSPRTQISSTVEKNSGKWLRAIARVVEEIEKYQ
jgi:hypothetical protein